MSFLENPLNSEDSFTFSSPITLDATESELWDRCPQGRPTVLSSSSMFPQVKITTEALRSLWFFGTSPKSSSSGILTALKYSPKHHLSLKAAECYWLSRGQPLPPADFVIYLLHKAPGRLEVECKTLDRMLNSVKRRLDKESVEPLDLFKVCIAHASDQTTQRLSLKCEILFPAVNFQLTPIAPLRLVSSPLVVNLTASKKDRFASGFVTLDHSGRVLPLTANDPMVAEYPVVGLWVAGLGDSSLQHPRLWSACVQFIETTRAQEKMSPDVQNCAFLLVHFGSKPTCFDVTVQEEPLWCTAAYAVDVPREEGSYFAPCLLHFARTEQSSGSFESSLGRVNSQTASSVSRATTPSVCAPRYTKSPSIEDGSFSPQSEQIIEDQWKMVAYLQEQINQLQQHINFQEKKTTPSKVVNNTGTNTTLNQQELTSMVNAETNTSFLDKSNREVTVKPQLLKSPVVKEQYNPLRYSRQAGGSPANKLLYSPVATTKAMPKTPAFERRLETQGKDADSTICVPLIQYDSGSGSDNNEDPEIESLTRKYLR